MAECVLASDMKFVDVDERQYQKIVTICEQATPKKDAQAAKTVYGDLPIVHTEVRWVTKIWLNWP